MAQWLASISTDIPYHISAFRPSNRMWNVRKTTAQDLTRAYGIAKAAGMKYVYLGNLNVSVRGTEDTCCPQCNTTLIQRECYAVTVHWKQPGICHKCGTAIPGRWTCPANTPSAMTPPTSSVVADTKRRKSYLGGTIVSCERA
jgi:pyruvate formate lyase activating enzyme